MGLNLPSCPVICSRTSVRTLPGTRFHPLLSCVRAVSERSSHLPIRSPADAPGGGVPVGLDCGAVDDARDGEPDERYRRTAEYGSQRPHRAVPRRLQRVEVREHTFAGVVEPHDDPSFGHPCRRIDQERHAVTRREGEHQEHPQRVEIHAYGQQPGRHLVLQPANRNRATSAATMITMVTVPTGSSSGCNSTGPLDGDIAPSL